ncbi:MAG: transporter substrate-binding domain-containing protein [Bauldia sp.]
MKPAGARCALTAAIALAAATSAGSQPRTILAVHSVSAPPFAQKVGDNPSEGIVIDLCNAIAADNGWIIEYQAMPFAEIIPAVAAGDADMICTGMTPSPERAAQVAFTMPYFAAGEGMAVLATDTTAYVTWE